MWWLHLYKNKRCIFKWERVRVNLIKMRLGPFLANSWGCDDVCFKTYLSWWKTSGWEIACIVYLTFDSLNWIYCAMQWRPKNVYFCVHWNQILRLEQAFVTDKGYSFEPSQFVGSRMDFVKWKLSTFCISYLSTRNEKARVVQQQGTRQLWNVSELFSILRCNLQLPIYKTHNTYNLHSCTVAYFLQNWHLLLSSEVFLFNVPRSRTPDIFAFVFLFQCGFVFECEFVFECGAQRRISLPECYPRAEDAFPAFAFLKSAVPPSLPHSICISVFIYLW